MAITQNFYRNTASRAADARPSLLLRGFVLLLDWQRRARQRAELAALRDSDLKDVGLSRADIAPETRKPFWQA